MSNGATDNIVDLVDYGSRNQRYGHRPGGHALREVRELACAMLKQRLGRMMGKDEDALFARAETAESSVVQTQYVDAMSELRSSREDIENDFAARFEAQFTLGIPRNQSRDTQSLRSSWETDGSGAGAPGKSTIEEDLAFANMVDNIRAECSRDLLALDRRIGFLLRDPDLEQWQNPLAPEAICEAFRQATATIETGLEVRLLIFNLFDQYLVCDLDTVYREVNQHLIRIGVMADINAAARSEPQPVSATPAPAMPASAPGATNDEQTSLDTLTFLQQGNVAAAQFCAGDVPLPISVGDLAAGQINVLHKLKNAALFQDMGKTSAVTIEMAAMLFDYVLGDKNIPEAMRALIGRLQIPMLKVAILDRQFFSSKSQPARQLFNRLASTAIGWNEQQGAQDPLYFKIESIVETVIDGFETDTRLFAELLDEFDAFLRAEQEQAEIRAERSAKVMEGRERLEVAESTTMEEIEPRISDQRNLEFVREFVTTHWKNLLFITCAREGKDSEAWKRAVATMDELIWSVKPKRSTQERQQLASIQSGLLERLRAGMERLSIPVTERDDFIARLVRAHGQTAVGENGVEEQPPGPRNTSASKAAPIARPTLLVKTQPNGFPKQPASEERTANDQYTAKVSKLKCGDWVEFVGSDGKPTRAKLSWISPISNSYLFTDRQGLKAGNYTSLELAELFRCARARTINAAPVMDRAVVNVLNAFRKP
jgi:hypothetical protein